MAKSAKVLILGGNGFIGNNLGQWLNRSGYDVYSFDRELPSVCTADIHYLQGDFFEEQTLSDILQGMDIVFHAISTINPGNSNVEYMRGYEKDFLQTVRLCELIKEQGCRLIFLSSGGTVYGRQGVQPIAESALPHPINHYGNLKLCIENTMMTFACQNGLDVFIARISNPYGPGQDYKKGVGFIDAVIKKALHGEKIEVWGDGEIVRDYIYIDDVCNALALLAECPETQGRIINISSGKGTSQNHIINLVRELHGTVQVSYQEARSVDLKEVILDNEKLKKMLQKPLCDIQTGINRYYDYIVASEGNLAD